ncbi:MAG: prepilin-type N-terminal cleavage/methylation domain-containing protein [Deltaproteobacteria bacterium]|nr:prepilin-type N-terminal cleavage/methylation domain-containing protein [Deltaproteobacteria bacterium]
MAGTHGNVQRTRARPARDGGFSILELMAVVTILAVLTMAAVASYRKYIQRGKSMEAIHMLADIGMKQALYFSLYGHYVDTNGAGKTSHTIPPWSGSPGASADGFYPSVISGGGKPWEITCPDDAATYPGTGWCALGVRPSGNTVNYQYITVGWAPGEAGTPSSDYIGNPTDHWWYAIARGDLDANGIFSTFVFSNEVNQVWSISEDQ